MANCGFKITMIGFYITIIFAFLVLTLSSVEYLAGTMTSAGCKTLFQDPSYSGLSIFSLKNAELLEGHTINISAGSINRDVLVQCRENRTLWTAIGADKVFDPSSVLNDLHLPSIDDETSKLVDQVQQELAEFKQQIESPKNQAGKAAQDLKTLGDSLDPYLSFSECSAFNPTATKNIENGVASLKSSVAYFSDEMQQINDILTTIIATDANLQEIQDDVRDLAEQPVRDGIGDILNDLTIKLLPCRGVYNTYHNLGSYLCGDLGGPVHGLWASAGEYKLVYAGYALSSLP
ncbi:hypothetical protein OESDEN_10084 [Oesophagostomum dentatum]|uniref:Uncharacterized protein n=1 Tax=Oesophagostomum dentatum TaxID=61180 RepID=A0A0B1SXR1_OESDE|nr:hypothetical protein OESDEN_10084 [Oesophagostomum dentatum]